MFMTGEPRKSRLKRLKVTQLHFPLSEAFRSIVCFRVCSWLERRGDWLYPSNGQMLAAFECCVLEPWGAAERAYVAETQQRDFEPAAVTYGFSVLL